MLPDCIPQPGRAHGAHRVGWGRGAWRQIHEQLPQRRALAQLALRSVPWALLCLRSAFLYSCTLCQIEAACPLRGLSKLGSPSRLWMDRRMVRTLYTADHFSCGRHKEGEKEGSAGWTGACASSMRGLARLETPCHVRSVRVGAFSAWGAWVRGTCLEDVEADVAVLVHVGVEAWRDERHLRRLVRVAGGELERELEGEPLVHLFTVKRRGRATTR